MPNIETHTLVTGREVKLVDHKDYDHKYINSLIVPGSSPARGGSFFYCPDCNRLFTVYEEQYYHAYPGTDGTLLSPSQCQNCYMASLKNSKKQKAAAEAPTVSTRSITPRFALNGTCEICGVANVTIFEWDHPEGKRERQGYSYKYFCGNCFGEYLQESIKVRS